MKTIPMIFNQEMVKALVDGRKTVTRRPLKTQPEELWAFWEFPWGAVTSLDYLPIMPWHATVNAAPCKVGDLIWVRETFQAYVNDENEYLDANFKTGKGVTVSYPATDELVEIVDMETGNNSCRKKPSIHMPRWASRLTLRVTGVRCERVQKITKMDAFNEGFDLSNVLGFPRVWFKEVWNSIYSNWDENPWVWVIEFDIIKSNVDEMIK